MRKLFQWPLDPASRTVRLALAEKRLDVEMVESAPWKPHPDAVRLKPDASGPILLDQSAHGRLIAVHTHAIIEGLEEAYTSVRLLPTLGPDRAEARRLWHWVETRFDSEVNGSLLAERLSQAIERATTPDSATLRQGAHALRGLLTYLNALAGQHAYLAGRALSVADLAAASQLSALDYFGDVDWDKVPDLRQWYSRMKSRPSFRGLLDDRLPLTKPAPHYDDLDF